MRLILAFVFVLSLAGNAFAGEKLTVLLEWFVNPDHAPLVVAKERGMFEKAGLDVELIAPSDPSAPPRLVATGEGDIAITYQPHLHLQVAEGLPLARIGTLIETPLNTLMVLKESGITSIADLKGKTIGYSVTGFEEAILSTMLKQAGLTTKDVTMVNINFSLSPSLIAGKVDAVIGAYRNFELNQLDLEKHPGLAFYPEEIGVPVYDELVYVVKNDRLDDPRFKTFIQVIEDATLWLTNHPDEAWELFASSHKDLNDELNKRAWRDTLPRFAKRPGAMDHVRYERFVEFLKGEGLIKEIPPLDSYAVELR